MDINNINRDRKEPIWLDLWNYIQEAERNRIGAHDPFPSTPDKIWKFQIYNGRNQVNICKKDAMGGVFNAVVDFIFEDHELVSGIPRLCGSFP